MSSLAPAVAIAERSAVVSKAVSRAAEVLGLTNVALARTIGVSEATASRLRAGNICLNLIKAYELALLLVRLFRSLDAVVGGDEAALRSWMVAGNRALGGVPRDLEQTATGLVAAVDYVDAARARVEARLGPATSGGWSKVSPGWPPSSWSTRWKSRRCWRPNWSAANRLYPRRARGWTTSSQPHSATPPTLRAAGSDVRVKPKDAFMRPNR